jgi:predicted RecA/RadA family phage recombinase
MKTYIGPKSPITFVAPSALTSGQVLLLGTIVGIVCAAYASGAKASMEIQGVYTMAKATGALTAGAVVYWDNAAGNVTATSSGNTKIGFVPLAAQSGDATVAVCLTGQV